MATAASRLAREEHRTRGGLRGSSTSIGEHQGCLAEIEGKEEKDEELLALASQSGRGEAEGA